MEYNEQKLIKKKTKYANESNYLALGETCMQLGEWYKDREEHQRALNEYKLAAKAYEKINKPMDRGLAFRMVGEMHSTLGQYKEALLNVQAYMRAALREANTKALQEAHTTMGRVYLQRAESFQRQGKTSDAESDLAEADRSFRTALSICDELKRILPKTELINMQARAHLNLGITLDNQNQMGPAKENMERAIRLAKEADLFDLLYTCYNAMALSSSRWEINDSTDGDHCGQTLRLLNLSLEVASRLTGRATKMCQTLMLMGTFFLKMDDFQSARQTLKRAYRLKTPVASDAKWIQQKLKVLIAMCRMEDELITIDASNYVRRKELYERMGDGACKLRNFSKAIDYYKLMLQNAEANGETDRQLIPCYVSLYQTYIDNRQYEEALGYLWKEHNIINNEPQEAYYTLMKIGKLYERQKKSFFEIQNIYLQAKGEARKLNSIELQRAAVQRAVKVLRGCCMDLMADNLEQEALGEGIDISNVAEPDSEDLLDQHQTNDLIDYDVEEDEEEDAERDTPNVGDEIDLNVDLTDDSDGDPALTIGEDLNKSTTGETSKTRKRGKRFAVRRNKKGETQLHQAAISGNKALAEQLLQLGHPVNERDFAGWLPLHEACIHGYSEIVTLLLDRGAHINDKGGTSCEGITPLHDACRNGHLDVITVLLDRGANATQRNDYGETALNMLDGWYKKLKVPLTSSEMSHYQRIKNELVAQFDAAAIPISPPTTSVRSTGKASADKRPLRQHRSDEKFEASLSSSLTSPSRSSLQTLKASRSSSGYVSEVGLSLRHRNVIYDDDNDRSTSGEESPSEDTYGSAKKHKSHKAAGVVEYRSVMNAMRKHRLDNEQSPTRATPQKKRQAPRFADEEEEIDHWLIDDMKQTTKKSRMNRDRESVEDGLEKRNSFSISTNTVEPMSDCETTRYCVSLDSDSDDLFEEQALELDHDQAKRSQQNNDKQSAFAVIMSNSAKSFRRTQSRRNSHESRSSSFGRQSSVYQSSLLDAGFERISSPTLEEKENFVPQECNSRTPIKQSLELLTPTVPLEQERFIKVILDNGETYTIQYDEQLNSSPHPVEWLANAVAKQYIINHGKQPLIKLRAVEGLGPSVNSCLNSDTLHKLLQTGSTESTTVYGDIYGQEHVDLVPFFENYCTEHKLVNDTNLRNRLKMMDRNHSIILENDFAFNISSLAEKHVMSIVLMVAFFQQDWLKRLDLSMNSITDDDVATLVRYLPSCRQLRILQLAGNMLTSKSVEMLCFGCRNASEMATNGTSTNPAAIGGGLLARLDLSSNPLEDDALVPLSRLCSNLPFLRFLRIRSTEVTNFNPTIFPTAQLNRLETFDISDNKLTERSVQCLLEQLAEGNLREAYLTSLPVHCINMKPKLWQTLSQNRMNELRILNLGNCRLTDDEIETTLLPAIGRNCASLAQLDLSHNISLTKRSFLAIFRHCASAVFELKEVNFHHDIELWVDMETFDSTNQLLELIEYSPTVCYPTQIYATLPVCPAYSAERCEKLLAAMEHFWCSLRPSSKSCMKRHANTLHITLSVGSEQVAQV
ncbi:tonsoku-like protein [Anopheles marshallii]|uniref:tonsoku-like protein n=1 Tax=Anopheles marshallii TaxID=1521116 RepID=UPI00237AD1D9|nr:tonsoku-like protein [Anopheles marshallii]